MLEERRGGGGVWGPKVCVPEMVDQIRRAWQTHGRRCPRDLGCVDVQDVVGR